MKNELPQAGIVLVDREGRKTNKSRSDPFASNLAMELKVEGLLLEMKIFSSPYSNGSSWLKVTDEKTQKVVYEGGGDYFGLGAGCTPNVYKPGPWEEKILARSRRYVERI